MEKTRVFADGMESVSLTEGMIRMELFQYAARATNGTAVPREISGELLMTPQGFFRAFSAMENLMKQLADAGLVKRSEGKENAGSAAAPTVSPNFN